MGKLMDFLLANSIGEDTKEVVVSDRLKDHPFTIKAIAPEKYDAYLKRAQKDKALRERRAELEFIFECCVEPNFRDAETIKAAGCKTPQELIDKVLLIGEQKKLYLAISKISGFDELEAQVREVKN